ncbi:MAG TPA: lipoyl(octanoyl) transferase LipB [Actinoplanes sp.]|nr:lipoyl(octanoyl) transferase LipB [Actinoplanes sp.]
MSVQRVDLGEIEYTTAIERMSGWAAERRAGTAPDRLFLLSHPPVITFGRRTPPTDLPRDLSAIPAVEADRGGNATYHGPGQLIGYLVMDLRERGPVDVVRRLENGLIAALDQLGFPAIRRDTPPGSPSLVGVWTPDHRKIVSIGMRIRGGITTHGFALNVDPDLSVFDRFIACSLDDVVMTSLRQLAGEQGVPAPSDTEVRDAVGSHLR